MPRQPTTSGAHHANTDHFHGAEKDGLAAACLVGGADRHRHPAYRRAVHGPVGQAGRRPDRRHRRRHPRHAGSHPRGKYVAQQQYGILAPGQQHAGKGVALGNRPVVSFAEARTRDTAQPLSLIPYEEMDSKVVLGGISKPFEILYSDQLQTLNVRLAFLLERDILRVSQNPFRPEVFLLALQQAWLAFDPEPASANLLLPLLKPGMFVELGPMLEALNLALQRKGVLPGSVEGYKGRKADAPAAPAVPAPTRARGQQAVLAEQLRQFFAGAESVDEDIDLSIPDIPMVPMMAGGSWVQGPAQGFHGAMNNAVVQRQAQVGVKRPLLNYLAQL